RLKTLIKKTNNMSIYMTQARKNDFKQLIDKYNNELDIDNPIEYVCLKTLIGVYEELISQSIILPVCESWENVEFPIEEPFEDLSITYPNGIIINK
ncbi:MAG: hypothetical protein WD512_19670, partial [Candidatus Paceibacterota bacterium]